MYNQVVRFVAGAAAVLAPAYLVAVTSTRTHATGPGDNNIHHTRRPTTGPCPDSGGSPGH